LIGGTLKSRLMVVFSLLVVAFALLLAQNPQPANVQVRHLALPTSKFLIGRTPGALGRLNGFTPTIAVSPDKHFAAFLNDGYGSQANKAHQSIAILNLSTNKIADFPDARLAENAHQSYFLGLAFSSDGNHLYASVGSITDPEGNSPGDTGNGIAVYNFQDGKVAPERFVKVGPQRVAAGRKVAYGLRNGDAATAPAFPAGLTVLPGRNGEADRLLVANNCSDNILLLDSATGRVLKTIDVSAHHIIPSEFPYTCVASRDGVRAWCSLWNASRVVMLNLDLGKVVRSISLDPPVNSTDPGSHPTALLLSPDENQLFVALSNTDKVMMVEIGSGPNRPLGTNLIAGAAGGKSLSLAGSCPAGLALADDGSRLFVADSCLDAIAIFDLAAIRRSPITIMPTYAPIGFIPTDWYPTALATVGTDLLIATSKGQGTGPNNFPSNTGSERRHNENAYIATLLYGSVARINYRDIERELPDLTKRVEDSNRFDGDSGKLEFAQGSNPIRHVIYILKENRTYDQVLGDLKAGDGNPSLTLYGNEITPNEHKLALQFGVLDNFYDSGEVSGDGHNWSTAAITTDYNENTWQIAYRGLERTYDFQGNVGDEIPLENNQPDVNAPVTGYIWDNLAAHRVSYRVYGEFVDSSWCKPERVPSPKEGTPSPFSVKCDHAEVLKGEPVPANVGSPHGSASPWPWAVPLMKMTRPTKPALRDHIDTNFPDFNVDYPDQFRADEFLNEFDGFVRARKNGSGPQLPAFILLYLPNDHTHGTTPGHPRPAASVADNDLAVGRVVEAVSHSPYWDDTAIFILEDDAQNGADHVDAHRSTAFVISKYSPGSSDRPFVEHRFYTTVNMIHTMESLLGLPGMNQFDAYAPVMSGMFSGPGNQPPYVADWSNRDNGSLYLMNPPRAEEAEESSKMDFSRPDAANAAVLNAILWRDRKGSAAPMPFPQSSSVAPNESRGDD
jgi:DNA-binding beta-propeller fold protein YncE